MTTIPYINWFVIPVSGFEWEEYRGGFKWRYFRGRRQEDALSVLLASHKSVNEINDEGELAGY